MPVYVRGKSVSLVMESPVIRGPLATDWSLEIDYEQSMVNAVHSQRDERER